MTQTPSRRLLAAALAAACACPAFAGATPAAPRPTSETGTTKPVSIVDEPDIYLARARADLERRLFTRAAADVRKAAAVIDAEAARANDANRARLKQDARALLRVAADIDAGRVADGKQIDVAISKARTDLAVHYEWRAAEAWVRDDARSAGRALAASARYAESAFVSLGANTSGKSDELRKVERFGVRLAHRAAKAAESDWTRARHTLGRVFERLREDVERRYAS